jgi:hypothetical protein
MVQAFFNPRTYGYEQPKHFLGAPTPRPGLTGVDTQVGVDLNSIDYEGY